MTFSVAIYSVAQRYGGPEEGGWWYEAGEPVYSDGLAAHVKRFHERRVALAYLEKLEREVVDPLNRGRPAISSVRSQGVFAARLVEGEPRPFPERIPVYE